MLPNDPFQMKKIFDRPLVVEGSENPLGSVNAIEEQFFGRSERRQASFGSQMVLVISRTYFFG